MTNNKLPRKIIIIPARYASTRFPGKPLAILGDKEVINHVASRARLAQPYKSVVATDDERILDAVRTAGYEAVMTRNDHKSGTDRVAEAYDSLSPTLEQRMSDIVINIQGDEPFILPEQINQLYDIFIKYPDTQIATLSRRFDPNDGFEALFDPNLVKLTYASDMRALYFSRSIIPYVRGVEWKEWLDKTAFHTHIGIYAYRGDVLGEICRLPQSPLEKAESLEQLRWLENGYTIRVGITDARTVGIDTPADLEAAARYL